MKPNHSEIVETKARRPNLAVISGDLNRVARILRRKFDSPRNAI
jgi:hypothetical protein